MKNYKLTIKIVSLCSLLLTGVACDPGEKPVVATEQPSKPSKQFKVHGIIQEIKPGDQTVIVDHAEIPGYMGAMIMPFKVKEAAELTGLAPGDEIQFDFCVEELQSWIENIRLTGKKGEVKAPGDGEPEASPGKVLPVNSQLGDYRFIDETGKPVKLSDYRGGPVAMTFVFSRCPVPEYCPAMMRNFSQVAVQLETEANAPASWTLLTVSFDVEYDTPEVMRAWGSQFGFKEGLAWHLLSAEKGSDTIQKISQEVGLKFGESGGSYQHNLRTVVLDGHGKISHVFTDETWSPDELVAELKKAVAAGE
jgi:protein SCO1/2